MNKLSYLEKEYAKIYAAYKANHGESLTSTDWDYLSTKGKELGLNLKQRTTVTKGVDNGSIIIDAKTLYIPDNGVEQNEDDDLPLSNIESTSNNGDDICLTSNDRNNIEKEFKNINQDKKPYTSEIENCQKRIIDISNEINTYQEALKEYCFFEDPEFGKKRFIVITIALILVLFILSAASTDGQGNQNSTLITVIGLLGIMLPIYMLYGFYKYGEQKQYEKMFYCSALIKPTSVWTIKFIIFGAVSAFLVSYGIGIIMLIGWFIWGAFKTGRKMEFHFAEQEKEDFIHEIENKGIYKEEEENNLRHLYKMRFAVITLGFKETFNIPMNDDSIDSRNYEYAWNTYFELLKLSEEREKTTNPLHRKKIYDEIADKKLEIFYMASIKGEAKDDVYSEFERQLQYASSTQNINLLRQELPASQSIGANLLLQIDDFKWMLEDNKMEPILQKFKYVKNKDTHSDWGDWTSVDKLNEQTNDLQALYHTAKYEYDELTKLGEKISYALDFARICAYRNLYLGIELLNYIRNNAGGKNLTTQKDNVDFSEIYSLEQMGIGQVNGIGINDFMSNFSDIMQVVCNNSTLIRYMKTNKKVAIGAAAVAGVFAYLEARNQKIEQNSQTQKQLVIQIRNIADGYSDGQAQLIRELEIIQAIVKSNKGFMAIYSDLAEKTFKQGYTPNKKEMNELCIAINEYKKISDTKIK